MRTIILCVVVFSICTADSFSERKSFHDRLCQKKPELSSCQKAFTYETYTTELENFAQFENLRKLKAEKDGSSSESSSVKRSTAWWADSEEDDDYEYYLWRKYQREKYRRRHGLAHRHSTPELHRHYHYHQTQNRPTYSSYPSYGTTYPAYSSYYPSYGYGSGYGGYGGQVFNMGMGRQLGISTPIGGFGISSGFGIGIG